MHYLRALVVDDSKVGRLTMLKKLEAIGVKVDMTESGQQALDYLAQHRPDLIFMDHMMPDMDGFEVTQRIKAAPATRDIPVIIVSGSDDETFVEQARAIGALNAITKPPADGVLETILGSLPKAVAEPAPVPSMDQAAVHALAEKLLAGAMQQLHDNLMVAVEKRMEAEFESQRKTLQESSEGWRERLDQTSTDMAELRHGAMDAETLGRQLNGIELRLLPLESEAARRQPDLDAVQANLDQRIASGLAELQARTDRQEPLLEGLRQELLARLDDHGVQIEQRIGGLDGSLDTLSADMNRLSGDAQSAKIALDQRFSAMDQRLAAIENTEASPGLDAETLLATMDNHISMRLAETMGGTRPPTEAMHASDEQVAQAQAGAGNNPLQAELDQLKTKVRTLALMIAIGGAVLLAAIGMLFLRG